MLRYITQDSLLEFIYFAACPYEEFKPKAFQPFSISEFNGNIFYVFSNWSTQSTTANFSSLIAIVRTASLTISLTYSSPYVLLNVANPFAKAVFASEDKEALASIA